MKWLLVDSPGWRFFLFMLLWIPQAYDVAGAETSAPQTAKGPVAKWGRFEAVLQSTIPYENPPQSATLKATFKSPAGVTRVIDGFWDGGDVWRVRFSPNETGDWSYVTQCSDAKNTGLQAVSGRFTCSAPVGQDPFAAHGSLVISPDRRSLRHEDGTPFFWLADTAWNGALRSTGSDWDYYLKERGRQKFTAIQWVSTQWRAAPDGDVSGRLAYSGRDKILVNPAFFQSLDAKVAAMSRAGLLSAPVLLWAIGGGSNPAVNPGFSLPEDQAILLARYMVARWGAYPTVWILGGDGDYRGPQAARWKHIGQAVFGDLPHAPVTLHPGGMQWISEEFAAEKWWDICAYQSGHGDDDKALRWLMAGPPSEGWKREPARPLLNLEPPYEGHLAYQSRQPISPLMVRRAIYWSLLVAPTAGVTYGGHGVWGWDDGAHAPVDHPDTGIPQAWKKALSMPAAEQMAHVRGFFGGLDFWRLRPASDLLASQPGIKEPRRFIASARSEKGDLAVVYVPEDRMVEIRLNAIPPNVDASWFNPRSGERNPVVAVVNGDTVQFATPTEGDWILLMQSKK